MWNFYFIFFTVRTVQCHWNRPFIIIVNMCVKKLTDVGDAECKDAHATEFERERVNMYQALICMYYGFCDLSIETHKQLWCTHYERTGLLELQPGCVTVITRHQRHIHKLASTAASNRCSRYQRPQSAAHHHHRPWIQQPPEFDVSLSDSISFCCSIVIDSVILCYVRLSHILLNYCLL